MSVGYQHLRGLHLLISVNQNVPTCIAAGTNNGCRPNPNYGNNSQYSSLADSNYNGLHISYLQRPARWGSYRVSYTYSKALDNVSEFFFSAPIDNFNIWQDYGRSDDDQRHRLVFDGSLHSPTGKSYDIMGTASAMVSVRRHHVPILLGTAFQYHDRYEYDPGYSRPSHYQRHLHRPQYRNRFRFFQCECAFKPGTFRTMEHLRMEATLEAFNLFNHVNGVALNGAFGAGTYPTNPLPTYKQITAVDDPRTLQLGLRLSF